MDEKQSIDDVFKQAEALGRTTAPSDCHVPIGFLDDLTRSRSQAEILQCYSVWSKKIIGCARSAIALGQEEGVLTVFAMDGDAAAVPLGTRLPIANSLLGEVYRRQQPIVVRDGRNVASVEAPRLRRLGYKSGILAPITSGGTCFGVLAGSFKVVLDAPQPMLAVQTTIARALAGQMLLIQQMEDLAHAARTDPLTGVANRHALREQADEVWSRWENLSEVFWIISIDLDHFKLINDTFGHDTGDIVLCEVAVRLTKATGGRARIFRLGGEEFGALYPKCDRRTALNTADRILSDLRSATIQSDHGQISVTASIGLACSITADASFNDTLKRADRALYAAKAGGRDQFVEAKEDT